MWQQKAGFTKANEDHAGGDGNATFDHPDDPSETQGVTMQTPEEELTGAEPEPTLGKMRHQETEQGRLEEQDRPETPAAGEQQLPADGSETRRTSGRKRTPS